MDFADRLRQKRDEKGLSREKLARLIGCSASYISSIEGRKKGALNPTKDFILKASEILRVSTDWLLKGEERYPDLETIQEIVSKARSPKESPPGQSNGEVQQIPLVVLSEIPDLSWDNKPLKAAAGPLKYKKKEGELEWIPKSFVSERAELVAVKVEGQSMCPHFCEKEIVFVDFGTKPNINDFCVCETKEGRAYLKRIWMISQESWYLHSTNPAPEYTEPLIIPFADVRRIGKIIFKQFL